MVFLSLSLSTKGWSFERRVATKCSREIDERRACTSREKERRKKSKSSVNEGRKRGLELDKEKRIFSYLPAKIDAIFTKEDCKTAIRYELIMFF